MDKEKLDYIPASPPDIIVRSLTEENIREAVEAYAQGNAFWLKLYFLAGTSQEAFNIEQMNKALEEIKRANEEIFKLYLEPQCD